VIRTNEANDRSVLPPGPSGRWLPTLQLVRNPRKAFEGWAKQYGDPFFINALNGPVVITGRPDLIREIFGHEPDEMGLFATGTVKPILGEGSLLMMDGQAHRRERRMLTPLFHGERMKAYGQTFQHVALQQIAGLGAGQQFVGLDLMQNISQEIIARAIFGGQDEETISEMKMAARQLARNSSPLIFFSKRMQFSFFGFSPWDNFRQAQRRLFAALDREIQIAKTSGAERHDILALLLRARYDDGSSMNESHLKDELSTLLFAGHETSALAMAWAMYHVHRHPTVLDELRASLDAGDDSPESLAKNEYLKAVIQETLRLNPIVTEVLRMLKTPLWLDRYEIPAGIAVAPAAALAHYNPTTFPDPDSFRPERFLDRSYTPFEYLPFGGGHRRCIGAAFANYEMAVVLGTLFRRYEFELLEKREVVSVRRNVTMGPSTGISLKLIRNRTAS
jgi:cytochrome P450 family 110